ncbi:MAG TPA: hypothetical protein VFT09_03775, partial [Ilumatobacteraceae bacterium]|nr:hypothetical protein [Ilumatobacteraceae bacterium]
LPSTKLALDYLNVTFPAVGSGFALVDSSVTDADFEVEIGIFDPTVPAGPTTFGPVANGLGWRVTLLDTIPTERLAPGVFRYALRVERLTGTAENVVVQFRFKDGTWDRREIATGTVTPVAVTDEDNTFDEDHSQLRQGFSLTKNPPTTIAVTFPATATGGFTLDHTTIADLAADFADADSETPGIQLHTIGGTTGWTVTLDQDRSLVRVGTTDTYLVPIVVTLGATPSATAEIRPELLVEGGVTTGIGFTGTVVGGTQTATPNALDTEGEDSILRTNARTFVDVAFSPTFGFLLLPGTIDGDEFAFTGFGAGSFANGTTPFAVMHVGGNVWRFLFTSQFAPGAVEVQFAEDAWEDGPPSTGPPTATYSNLEFSRSFLVSGATADLVRTIPATDTAPERIVALGGATIGRDAINGRGYLEVTFRPSSGNAVDHTSINGDELQLRDATGALVALGAPVRVGTTDTYRYALLSQLATGRYTVTFAAGSIFDTGSTPNQAETEEFLVVAASAGLDEPTAGQVLDVGAINGRGYIDVTFGGAGIDAATVLDNAAEFTLTMSDGKALTVAGRPVLISGTTYRYFFTGFKTGTTVGAPVFLDGSWTDLGGDRVEPVTGAGGNVSAAAAVTGVTWIDILYRPAPGAQLADVDGDELQLSGGGSELLTQPTTGPKLVQLDATTFRYIYV